MQTGLYRYDEKWFQSLTITSNKESRNVHSLNIVFFVTKFTFYQDVIDKMKEDQQENETVSRSGSKSKVKQIILNYFIDCWQYQTVI